MFCNQCNKNKFGNGYCLETKPYRICSDCYAETTGEQPSAVNPERYLKRVTSSDKLHFQIITSKSIEIKLKNLRQNYEI
jgi:C4-type Zn-finger protein